MSTDPGLESLYREVILDHYKNPRGHGVIEDADAEAEGQNPLCEGDWDEDRCCVVCPRHGSMFELSTGQPISLPATEPVETYPVRVVDGAIVVELP